mmetsp:Transcript_607/g.2065  ORF Transcript_607/g.2065 Transcript_607/m.2065 type:complete len:204 (+) Transcript_607:689-1300(+)
MTRVHRRAATTASAILRRSFVINTTPAASAAIAVPCTPMAMPTSAEARAGPSFTPSPIIPTTPFRCNRCTSSSFSEGLIPARGGSVIPTASETSRAVSNESPVSITGVIPSVSSARTAVVESDRMRSDMRHAAPISPSMRIQSTVWPLAFQARTCRESTVSACPPPVQQLSSSQQPLECEWSWPQPPPSQSPCLWPWPQSLCP